MSNNPIYTLGHSPDPDDAFMFYAMAEEKIDLRGYRFQHILQDIQTLNERAGRGELHISAISIHAYAFVLDRYALLPNGASMGDGYGPMLVALEGTVFPEGNEEQLREWLRTQTIAIPGAMTSAYLALRLYLGDCETITVPFDQIFDSVKQRKAAVGLIIHEGQLTYRNEGFVKVRDLGEWWKSETGLPLPLGGNVVRKDIDPQIRKELSQILRESIDYGLAHRTEGVKHSMPLARGMDEPMADEFIGMYVNDFTRDYGDVGRRAIREFLGRASKQRLIPHPVELEFVE